MLHIFFSHVTYLFDPLHSFYEHERLHRKISVGLVVVFLCSVAGGGDFRHCAHRGQSDLAEQGVASLRRRQRAGRARKDNDTPSDRNLVRAEGVRGILISW
jgi:hypothetical protein